MGYSKESPVTGCKPRRTESRDTSEQQGGVESGGRVCLEIHCVYLLETANKDKDFAVCRKYFSIYVRSELEMWRIKLKA